MTTYLYLRVSTEEQSQERQMYLLEKAGYNAENSMIYTEIYSGKTMRKRPILLQMLRNLQKDDVIVVESLSRLARSTKDLLQICDDLQKKQAGLISLKEKVDLTSPMGKFFITMVGAVSQFERDVIAERTHEALQAKKQKGQKLGRTPKYADDLMRMEYENYKKSDTTLQELANKYDMNYATVQRRFAEFRKEEKTKGEKE